MDDPTAKNFPVRIGSRRSALHGQINGGPAAGQKTGERSDASGPGAWREQVTILGQRRTDSDALRIFAEYTGGFLAWPRCRPQKR